MSSHKRRRAASQRIARHQNVEAHVHPVDHVGSRLRQARESAGLTVDELARRTKIPRARLAALESAEVANLAAVYTRGFVKAYAREVGLAPDETAREYLAAVVASPGDSAHVLEPAATSFHVREFDIDQRIAATSSRRLARLTTVGAAIGLLVYVVTLNRLAGRQSASAPDDSTALAPAQVTAAAAPAVPQAPPMVIADRSAVATVAPIDVELRSQGPCWLVLTVDGQRVLMRLLQAGERMSFAVTQEARLRVGDPSALTLTINGQTVRALGPPGQPVNVTISRETFKTLLIS